MPLALQATLPDELARACNIDVTDARRIVSLVHRTGNVPERSPATIRRAALDAARAAGHVPSICLESRAEMPADEIAALIRSAIPDAEVTIRDLAGDGDHYSARVVSASFAGLTRVKQHQAVYAALGGRMGGELHALQLETAVP